MLYPILVVEDDAKIARIVKVYLEGAGFQVRHFDRGKDALEAASREKMLLALLDLMLPDMSGEEVCLRLKEVDANLPIIMLTAKASEEERVAGFALGADDYVVKPFSPRELVFRVKAVLKRFEKGDLTGTEVMSFNGGKLVLDGRSYQASRGGQVVRLTPTEFKLLFALASTPYRVFSRSELVEKALGYQFEGYERSVDAHIKNIRRKIEDDPQNPALIQTIYGVGYRFSGKRDEKAPLA
ncbi:MAG TPA: DNA-binding response regulator [Deltaproteobacteria bacterium]|jgi:two-component system OmpR family response regulator|nr:DNA-binding response regulator [Deltaproteobacteria bacterium]